MIKSAIHNEWCNRKRKTQLAATDQREYVWDKLDEANQRKKQQLDQQNLATDAPHTKELRTEIHTLQQRLAHSQRKATDAPRTKELRKKMQALNAHSQSKATLRKKMHTLKQRLAHSQRNHSKKLERRNKNTAIKIKVLLLALGKQDAADALVALKRGKFVRDAPTVLAALTALAKSTPRTKAARFGQKRLREKAVAWHKKLTERHSKEMRYVRDLKTRCEKRKIYLGKRCAYLWTMSGYKYHENIRLARRGRTLKSFTKNPNNLREADYGEVERHVRNGAARNAQHENMRRHSAIASTISKLAQRIHDMPCRTVRRRMKRKLSPEDWRQKTLVFFGGGSWQPRRGQAPAPRKLIVEQAAYRGSVLVVNESNTSRKCAMPGCSGNNTEVAHREYSCSDPACPLHNKRTDRDASAAVNQLLNGENYINGNEWLDKLFRPPLN